MCVCVSVSVCMFVHACAYIIMCVLVEEVTIQNDISTTLQKTRQHLHR